MPIENDEIIESNTDAINIFYSDDNDVNKMSTFLFEMLVLYTKTDSSHTDNYKADCLNNFEMLHTLINNIVPLRLHL